MRREPASETQDAEYRTEPPDVARQSLKRRLGERLSRLVMPMIAEAARPYLGGDTLNDALCVAGHLKEKGFATAFSYWDRAGESLATIESRAFEAIAHLSVAAPDSYLALKPPALRFCPDRAARIAAAAAAQNIQLHFDSHGKEAVDPSNAMLDAMLREIAPSHLGTTMPGALARSLADADWAASRGLAVRVVKGAWPDPADPKRDTSQGFSEIIAKLAGRARYVRVATHDAALGRRSVETLREKGTPCEIEVLLGLAAEPLIHWAKRQKVPVRVYVPYGSGFIPNAIGVMRRNPKLALAIAKSQAARLLGI